MSATLLHRGPDSEGTYLDGPVGLGARRLAIIDLSGGDQPIASEDGSVVVVQNGEIYNFRELLRELERAGHTFRTRCDTEVLVHGYEEWGPRLWERLRGMFAVAIWEVRAQRLVLARDRFGIKPLYYRDKEGELSFASELDALPQGDLDLDALEGFLAFNVVPAPLSIFKDIRKLLPGHALTWQNGRVTIERYARTGPLPARHDEDEAELLEECRAKAARFRAGTSDCRRARRSAAFGRSRLGRTRCPRGRGVVRARAHILHRLRGGVLQRARRGAPGCGALRHRAIGS